MSREEWVVRKIVRDEEMHRHPDGGYAVYEGNRAVTGWGHVTQSKEDAELICNAVNGYDAGRSAREWRRVEEVGLPTVSGKYIVLRCEIVTGEIEPDVDEFKDGQFNPFLADVIAYIGPLPIYVENENAN